MLNGIHALVYSKNARAARKFFKDVMKLKSVDAGGGWLIFALPPTELAVHPARTRGHELYLMCKDIESTVKKLRRKRVKVVAPIVDRGWGLVTRIRLESGDEFGLDQPKHPTAHKLR